MHIEYANMSISQRVYELINGHPKRDESYILDSKNLEIIYIFRNYLHNLLAIHHSFCTTKGSLMEISVQRAVTFRNGYDKQGHLSA